MQTNLGVMQGRLLPKYKDQYQAHPFGYWQDEFPLARQLQLNCIEFIFDFENYDLNPLMTEKGRSEIIDLSRENSINVKSICADYFMKSTLHSTDEKSVQKNIEILQRLIKASSLLNVTDIVIPCVEGSSIDNNDDLQRFVNAISGVISNAEQDNVNLSLETDLEPSKFGKLLKMLNSEKVKVNYDIGNSASLGYDPIEEFSIYGHAISDVHIKDRVRGGGSVMLGSGDADIEKCFNLLEEYNFNGPLIMQAYRDEEGVEVFKKQLNWLRKLYNLR